MNMPGFTAEAALRSITRVYRASASIVSKTHEIQMQMVLCDGPSGYETCCTCSDARPSDCYECLYPDILPSPELFSEFT